MISGFFIGLGREMGLPVLQRQISLMAHPEEETKGIRILLSQNSDYNKTSFLPNYKGVHIIRDPRDITISAYHSYKNTHAISDWDQLADLREKLKTQSFEEGLFTLMDFNGPFLDLMENWNYGDENILEIKFEDFNINPEIELEKMVAFWGLLSNGKTHLFRPKGFSNKVWHKLFKTSLFTQEKVDNRNLQRLHKKVSFQKLSQGRKTGQGENTSSHYRKGSAGDWKEHFSEAHKDYFKTRHPMLLQKLGYEETSLW